jgi:hypothetical protein
VSGYREGYADTKGGLLKEVQQSLENELKAEKVVVAEEDKAKGQQ